MVNTYNSVIITKFNDRKCRYICDNEAGYLKYLKNEPDMAEVIGEFKQQIKPILDIDAYINDIDINEVLDNINRIFPNKSVKYATREVRETKKGLKYSYRFYVQDVRITSKNLKILLIKNGLDKIEIYDMSIYDTNKILFLPLTTKKVGCDVPPLMPIDCSIFECCASYIKEEYEDWDLKMIVVEEPIIKYKKIVNDNDDENFDDKDKYNSDFILDILNHLSVKRANNHDIWKDVCFSIIGASSRSKLSRTSCSKLIHHFSQFSKDAYDEFKVDEWIDINYKRCMKAEKSYGYRQLIHIYLKEDDLTCYENKYDKTYENVKKQLENEIIKCENDYCYIQLNLDRDEINSQPFFILEKGQLLHKFNDKLFFSSQKKIKDKIEYIREPVIHKWLLDENKRRCINLCFKPYQLSDELNEKHFNLFRGFRASKLPVCKDYSKIERILFHLKVVISNGDEKIFNWMLKYLKAIINGKRTDVMIMIKGLEGCGKNIFINMFAYGIIGKEYATATSIPEKQFFGQFNSSLQNRVLAVINEGKNGLRECIDRLKDFITEETISIEKKGKEPIILDNYCNFIGDTNNWNILNISPTDRRFVWLECSNEYVGNKEYFDELADVCKNDEALSAFYHYLIEEVSKEDINFQKTRPITAIYKKLQRVNLSNPIKFLINLNDTKITYKKYQDKDFHLYKPSDLYIEYKTFCMINKYEAFQLDQFESKITEKEDNGIKKGIFHKSKVFRIYRDEFEAYIKSFNCLEDLEDMSEELGESGKAFIDDD